MHNFLLMKKKMSSLFLSVCPEVGYHVKWVGTSPVPLSFDQVGSDRTPLLPQPERKELPTFPPDQVRRDPTTIPNQVGRYPPSCPSLFPSLTRSTLEWSAGLGGIGQGAVIGIPRNNNVMSFVIMKYETCILFYD